MFSFTVQWFAYRYETIYFGHASEKRRNKLSKVTRRRHVIFDSWKNLNNNQTSLSLLQIKTLWSSPRVWQPVSGKIVKFALSACVVCSRCLEAKSVSLIFRERSEYTSCSGHSTWPLLLIFSKRTMTDLLERR